MHLKPIDPSLVTDTSYTIRLARAEDLSLLPEIERAAAQRFREVGLVAVAAMEPTTPAILQTYLGRLWVVVAPQGKPVGFALAGVIDGLAHLQELSVHPAHGGRGLGTRLIAAVCAWAQSHALTAITLSTFRAVPWNAPFYARLGFRVLAPSELTPGLRAVRTHEEEMGLPVAERVMMRCEM